MPRLIDADFVLEGLDNTFMANWGEWKILQDCLVGFARDVINDAPTVEAIPIDWILNHEKMPKSGKGHDAIMDMIESWEERREDAEAD